MYIAVFLGLWIILLYQLPSRNFTLRLHYAEPRSLFIYGDLIVQLVERTLSNISEVDLQSTRLLKACIKAEVSAVFFFVWLLFLLREILSPSV